MATRQDWQVTSANRSAAKRLLNAWHDSRLVRNMMLSELNERLQRATSDGLITHEGIVRALGQKTTRKNDYEQDDKREDNRDNKHDNDERDEHDDRQNDGGNDDESREDEQQKNEQEKSQQEKRDEELAASKQQGKQEYEDGGAMDDQHSNDEEKQQAYEDGYNEAEDEDLNGKQDEEQDGNNDDDENDDEQEQDENKDENDEENEDEDKQDDDDDDDIEHEMLAVVMKYVKAGLNVALVGPAGSGKSYLSRMVAARLSLVYHSHGAAMSKYDLIGYNDANGTYHGTPAYDAIKEGGLLCFDEFDASAPEAGVAFNGMTDDQPFYTFPCGQVDKHESFVAICCMNTYGNGASADYVGRFKQDAASMSRFVKVYIDYDVRVERRIAGEHVDILQRVWDLREACTSLGIRHIVSTRMIDQARKARVAKVTRKCLDRDVLFAGLDDGAIKQVKAQMKQIATNRKRGA